MEVDHDDVFIIKEEIPDADEGIQQAINTFHNAFLQDSVLAVKYFDGIVKIVHDHNFSAEHAFDCAKEVSEYIELVGSYKLRKLAETISDTDMLTKILILRHFRQPLLETFSIGTALSTQSMIGKDKEYQVFQKTPLWYPVAYGCNRNGKLGVGRKDAQLEELTPIWLPQDLKIKQIYMSGKHTLFLMSNGEFYGAGFAKNFLVEDQMVEEDLVVPVKLDYVNVPPSKLSFTGHCFVDDTSSRFPGYNECSELVVGERAVNGTLEAGGQNWKIHVGIQLRASDSVVSRVELESPLTEQPKTYKVCSDGNWFLKDRTSREIVFFVCGRRVDSDRFWKKISICKNGTIYAHSGGALYSGKLVVGLGKKDRGDEEDGMEDDDESVMDEESLVVFMKEVSLPFAVEGFFVDESGESMIFYPKTRKDEPATRTTVDRALAFPSPLSAPIFSLTGYVGPPYCDLLSHDVRTGLNMLDDDHITFVYSSCPSEDPHPLNHVFTGLPMNGINYIRALRTLHHFVRTNEGARAPEVLLALDNLDSEAEFDENLTQELNRSIDHGCKISPLVAGPSVEHRAREIVRKAKIMLESIHADVIKNIEVLNGLPLRFRRQERDTKFANIVFKLMTLIKESKRFINPPNCTVDVMGMQSGTDLASIMRGRVERGEIDEEEARREMVVVEAISTNYTHTTSGLVSTIKSCWLYTTVTLFHLEVINPALLRHVEDGVLSLNACSRSLPQFRDLVKVFFQNPTSPEELRKHQKNPSFGIQQICAGLPDSAKYIITGSDEKELEVPGYLFQLYTNGFDHGRRNMAEQQGNPTNRMSVSCAAKVIEHLVETLLDPPSFYQLDMRFKIEVYHISKELMMLHIERDLLRMIVMSASETDYDDIALLFDIVPEPMAEFVGVFRPDIVFYWDKLPFDVTNLEILGKIARRIQKSRFKRLSHNKGPTPPVMFASEDGRVDNERLQKKWLFEQLFRAETDEDIRWPLTNSIMKWSGYIRKRGRKRCHGCGK